MNRILIMTLFTASICSCISTSSSKLTFCQPGMVLREIEKGNLVVFTDKEHQISMFNPFTLEEIKCPGIEVSEKGQRLLEKNRDQLPFSLDE